MPGVGLGCALGEAGTEWRGTIDTTATGTVVVSNPAEGIWDDNTRWRVAEEVRIGTMEGTGPDLFGRITDLEVDPAGRLWVFEGQVQELRVFEAGGRHVRTVGRKGGGPGEFNQVIGMTWAPDGRLWLVDPSNNRISMFDTSGTYAGSHRTLGGFVMSPWPGGFDSAGQFYTYVPDRREDAFGIALVKYDASLTPLDTIVPPRHNYPDRFFEARTQGGFMRYSVPYSPGLVWRLSPSGGFWAALTGDYRLFELDANGDTLRVITRAFTPIAVTAADIDSAIEGLASFTRQGGTIDRSKFPSVKPAIQNFVQDDRGNLWVAPITPQYSRGNNPRVMDVFDPIGRYLGRVDLPFELGLYPLPVFRAGKLYAVTRDELEVPYVVVALIEDPAAR